MTVAQAFCLCAPCLVFSFFATSKGYSLVGDTWGASGGTAYNFNSERVLDGGWEDLVRTA